MPRRSILLFAGACIVIAAAVAAVAIVFSVSRDKGLATGDAGASRVVGGSASGAPEVGGPFQLVDQNGRAVDQTLLNGKWTLVFFGFTYCPDYCPTTLNGLEATKTRMGEAARDLQIVFISVDPARDTPQALKDYLSSDGFPEGVIGLTGTPDQIATAAKAYRAYYEKVGESDAYTMNHSLTVYLMGPDGRFRSALAHDLGPERSAQLIERVMKRG